MERYLACIASRPCLTSRHPRRIVCCDRASITEIEPSFVRMKTGPFEINYMNELSAAPQAGTRHSKVVQCPLPRQTRKPLRQLWAGWRTRRFYPATTTGMSVLSRNFGIKVFRTLMDFRIGPNEAKPSKQTQRRHFRKRDRRVA